MMFVPVIKAMYASKQDFGEIWRPNFIVLGFYKKCLALTKDGVKCKNLTNQLIFYFSLFSHSVDGKKSISTACEITLTVVP